MTNIRKLPSYDDLFASEPGHRPSTDAELTALLEQYWPEHVSEGGLGQALFADPADAERLTKLFKAFGCNVVASDAPLALVGRAYDVFALGLERFVSRVLRQPETDLNTYLHDWPPAWREYVAAVASQDLATTQRLFAKLQPLDPDTSFPPGVARFKRDE